MFTLNALNNTNWWTPLTKENVVSIEDEFRKLLAKKIFHVFILRERIGDVIDLEPSELLKDLFLQDIETRPDLRYSSILLKAGSERTKEHFCNFFFSGSKYDGSFFGGESGLDFFPRIRIEHERRVAYVVSCNSDRFFLNLHMFLVPCLGENSSEVMFSGWMKNLL
jgi:hypothetical protein